MTLRHGHIFAMGILMAHGSLTRQTLHLSTATRHRVEEQRLTPYRSGRSPDWLIAKVEEKRHPALYTLDCASSIAQS